MLLLVSKPHVRCSDDLRQDGQSVRRSSSGHRHPRLHSNAELGSPLAHAQDLGSDSTASLDLELASSPFTRWFL